mgnify:CR=1 FL=1
MGYSSFWSKSQSPWGGAGSGSGKTWSRDTVRQSVSIPLGRGREDLFGDGHTIFGESQSPWGGAGSGSLGAFTYRLKANNVSIPLGRGGVGKDQINLLERISLDNVSIPLGRGGVGKWRKTTSSSPTDKVSQSPWGGAGSGRTRRLSRRLRRWCLNPLGAGRGREVLHRLELARPSKVSQSPWGGAGSGSRGLRYTLVEPCVVSIPLGRGGVGK